MSAGLNDEESRRALLQAIVETTRAVYGAAACSIMRHDTSTRDLVFEAVAGEGAGTLVGQRIPATTGLAGWSLAAEEPIAVTDVSRDPRFARDVAEGTGYVPKGIIVYPLLHDEECLGVLNVLDQSARGQVGIADMDVLGRLAGHAAAVLALVVAARAGDAPDDPVARTLAALMRAEPERRAAARDLLDALERLL